MHSKCVDKAFGRLADSDGHLWRVCIGKQVMSQLMSQIEPPTPWIDCAI